jgi:tRNA (cmo5U34)-methyltransferase
MTDIPENQPRKLEPMADFFAARLEGYEEHMLRDGDDAYRKLAEIIPENTRKMLDLGCGTGLELDWIFKRLPDISVTGIDITQTMLDILKTKHTDKKLRLICEDYFKIDFGENVYDTVISSETMHHFSHEDKIRLYRKILKSLKPGGVYIEADYMIDDQEEEDENYAKCAIIRKAQGIPEGEFYHFDTPCTVKNQYAMLYKAGFSSVEFIFRFKMDVILLCRK